MHESYAHQLEIKKQQVEDALVRLGGFKDICVEDTLSSCVPQFYRNKMVFPIGGEKGSAIGGFYAPKSHRIIPLNSCLLGEKLATDALCAVLQQTIGKTARRRADIGKDKPFYRKSKSF